jgi:hypothetical protein
MSEVQTGGTVVIFIPDSPPFVHVSAPRAPMSRAMLRKPRVRGNYLTHSIHGNEILFMLGRS